jgi:hypothetical protein
MKTWLTKLRSSFALDREGRGVAGSPPHFQRLDERLRAARPAEVPAPQLHGAILRAVRAAGRERPPVPIPIWRWAAAGGVALVILGAAWMVVNRTSNRPVSVASQTAVVPMLATALDQGRALAGKAPEAALAPLSGEMELLHRDLAAAFNAVVASMP